MAYDSYLVQEADGTSRFTLEDGTGSLILETAVEIPDTPTTTTAHAPRGQHNPYRIERVPTNDDDIVIALILSLN